VAFRFKSDSARADGVANIADCGRLAGRLGRLRACREAALWPFLSAVRFEPSVKSVRRVDDEIGSGADGRGSCAVACRRHGL